MSAAIRAGYKQTEVGVIPGDWEAEALGSQVVITSGSSPSLFRFETTGTPYFKVDQLNNEAKYLSTTPYFFRGEQAVPLGSLIFPKRGASILLNKVRILVHDAFMDTNLMTLTPKGAMDSEYLYYALTHIQLWRIADTTSIPQINNKHITPLVLPRPPVAEQRAIAAALSDVDALLAKLDEFIAKKRDLKQAAMQQLLTGQTRLPGFSGAWEVKRLDALADIRSGGTPSTTQPEFWNGDVLWCTPTDITALSGFKYLSHTSRTITSRGLQSSSAELIPAGSIVMTSRATIGECAINAVPVATNQGFKNFVPYPGTNGEFLYYLLQTKKQDFIGLCSGSTFLEIGKTQLVRFEIKIPDKVEQTAIATILSDMDTELAALETRSDKTRALKQGMMQELLTGRIRVV